VAKVSSSGVVTFTGKNGDVIITGTYGGKTINLKTIVSLNYYTSKTWRLYADYIGLDVGTLKFNSNGTYTWYKSSGIIASGKWYISQDNALYVDNFGIDLDLTYGMWTSNDGTVYLTAGPHDGLYRAEIE
jgi:hypothetical protein